MKWQFSFVLQLSAKFAISTPNAERRCFTLTFGFQMHLSWPLHHLRLLASTVYFSSETGHRDIRLQLIFTVHAWV